MAQKSWRYDFEDVEGIRKPWIGVPAMVRASQGVDCIAGRSLTRGWGGCRSSFSVKHMQACECVRRVALHSTSMTGVVSTAGPKSDQRDVGLRKGAQGSTFSFSVCGSGRRADMRGPDAIRRMAKPEQEQTKIVRCRTLLVPFLRAKPCQTHDEIVVAAWPPVTRVVVAMGVFME